MIALQSLMAYAVAGLAVAAAFLSFGVARALPGVSLTAGARLLVLPGTIALWPLVLGRWLKPRRLP